VVGDSGMRCGCGSCGSPIAKIRGGTGLSCCMALRALGIVISNGRIDWKLGIITTSIDCIDGGG